MGFGLVVLAIGGGLFAIPALTGVLPGAILFGMGRVSAAADTFRSTPQVLSIAVGAWLIGLVSYRILSFVMAGTVLIAAGYLLSRREQWEKLPPQQSEAALEPELPTESVL